MKLRSVFILLICLFTSLMSSSDAHAQGKDFEPIFNGKDFTGWHGLGHFNFKKLQELPEEEQKAKLAEEQQSMEEHWSVDGEEIVNDGHGAYLTTDKEYGDMELLIDYRTVAKADSGIYLRGTPQVQIWDYTEEGGKWDRGADKGSGGLWNNSPGAPGKDPKFLADKPFGDWNHFRIRQVGSRTSVWLNERHVVDNAIMENFWDRESPLYPKGPIQLQTHGGEIRWRDVYLREIKTEEANKILSSIDDKGFEPIFDGGTLNGWEGATENYEVRDQSIVCKPGHGGTIYTKDVYKDFVVRLEFKLPPGGNNGLAIRYPGKGQAHLDGMCELQVLDNTAEQYAKLDPRQYHGSVYGMIPAARGYLRPVGEWNYQEVTIKGSTIKVELNGYVIVDGDVSKVTDIMGGKEYPGREVTEGHFGFAGHGDPVMFRKIMIKKL